jgi:flagellar hook-associated protein 2
MSSTFNVTGLVSDTDWQSLVTSINTAQKTAAEAPIKDQLTSQKSILSAWQSFNTSLSAVTNYIKTSNLNSDEGYKAYSASLTCADSSVTPSNVLTASIGKGTLTSGTYAIKVSNLATAEKIGSDTFASSSTALGVSGDMSINGKTISVKATDTLSSIASRINSANAGVSASVLAISDTEYRLTLQSTSSGSSTMTLRNADGSAILESLNLTSGSHLLNASGSNALSDSFQEAELLNASGANALSASYSDTTTAVGTLLGLGSPQSGTIQIQGTDDAWQNVSIDLATDSLQGIADKINAAGITGVEASVVSTTSNGTTAYHLQLTNVTASNLQDQNSVLTDLGVYQSGNTTAVGTLLGLGSPQSGTIQIQGTDDAWQNVSVDLATDSLQTIADKINAAAITGVTASVVPTTSNGTTTYQLQLTNVEASNLVDSNGILNTLGVAGGTAKNVLQAGQDAHLTVDGYSVASATNTVTGVIAGVTLNLTGTNPTTAINLNISRDNSSLDTEVGTLVDDLNGALEFISSQNTYDSSSTTANILMGNANLYSMKSTIVNTLLENISGNSTYTTAASIGIKFGSGGTLSVDSDTFAAALSDNPTEVLNAVKTLSTDLYSKLNVYVDPYTGTINSIESSINEQIDNLNDELTRVDENCAMQAEQLEAQYTALQALLSESSSTKSFLTAMVDSMTSSK